MGLALCLLFTAVTPVCAAESDMGDYLAKALGVTSSERNNYASNYSASLPVTYKKTSKSYYVALGGGTAYGHGAQSFDTCYADLIKNTLGFGSNYIPVGSQTGVTASEAVGYINGDNDREKKVPNAIKKADLITFQLDGVSLMTATKVTAEKVLTGSGSLNWEAYISDSAVLADIRGFGDKMTNEYTADFGKSNAESIAKVLECMLYECVVYSNQTVKAVSSIRNQNGSAVILVLGLYNPLRNLSITANGRTIKIGNIVDQMIKTCNAYLLKQTGKMSNVAFVDVSKTNTNGFGSIALDINDSNAVSGKLLPILTDEANQYANQAGHNYIAEQVKNALKSPCAHSNTTILDKKDATCTEKGYSGDTKCLDCNTIIKKGSNTSKAPHTYGDWTQIKAPSCSEAGEQTHTCTVCAYVETVAIETLSHTWNEGTVIKQPDCTNTGEKAVTCTVCSATAIESIPTADHIWDTGVETKQPDCMHEGEKTFTCTVCSVTKTETLPVADHHFGEYTANGDAACQQNGTKSAICNDCGVKDTVVDPDSRLEHVFENGVCTRCGAEEPSDSVTTVVIIMIVIAVVLSAGSGFLGFWLAKKKVFEK